MVLYGQLNKSTLFISTDVYSTGGAFFDNTAGLENNLGSLELNYLDDIRIFALVVSPTLGYFASDHWLVGSGIVYLHASYSDGFSSSAEDFLSFRPFVRYYFNPQKTNVHYFAEAAYNRSFDLGNTESNSSGAGAGAGVTYRLTESVVLDGSLGYNIANLGQEEERFGAIQASATLNILLNNGFRGSRSTAPVIQKGTWLTGVNDLSISASSVDRGVDRQFTLRPKLLYFLSDRWALGAGVEYSVTRQRFLIGGVGGTFEGKFRDGGFSFVPQVRYYFTTSQRIMFFATAGVEVRRQVSRVDERTAGVFGGEEKSVTRSQNASIGVGANVFITPNFAFEFGPSFRYAGEEEFSRFGIDAGIQLFFGSNGE
jgi:opacity protein-like surface antigen